MSWLKEKLLSRKFLTALAAIGAATAGIIPWSDAVNVILVWMSVQGVSDAVTAFKGEK